MLTDQVQQAIDAVIETYEAAGQLAGLDDAERVVLFAHGAQGVIDNGGFEYFFENNWPETPPYAAFAEAFRTIGARDAAYRLERAVAVFPFPNPHLDEAARRQFLETLPNDHEFRQLSKQACGDENVWTQLADYVQRHGPEIRRGGRTRG